MNPTHALICQLAWMVISLALALVAAWVMLRPPSQPSADSESQYDECEMCGSRFPVDYNAALNEWSCPQCQTRVNMAESAIICSECGCHQDGQPVHTAAHIRPTMCTACAFRVEVDAFESLESL